MSLRRCKRCKNLFRPMATIVKPDFCERCSKRKVYSTKKKPTMMSRWL